MLRCDLQKAWNYVRTSIVGLRVSFPLHLQGVEAALRILISCAIKRPEFRNAVKASSGILSHKKAFSKPTRQKCHHFGGNRTDDMKTLSAIAMARHPRLANCRVILVGRYGAACSWCSSSELPPTVHPAPTPILPLVYHPIPLNAPLHNRVGLITPSSSSKLLPLVFVFLLVHYLRKHLSFSILDTCVRAFAFHLMNRSQM